MNQKPIFVTGIGTGIGKTVVSAVLVEQLKADYWKPIQSGDLENTDTDRVRKLTSNSKTKFHPETYRLTQPFSPHKSAELDGIRIDVNKIILPLTKNQLIIEGAGGLMVPLNDQVLMIDLIKKLDVEVILVIQHYLGSINHSLLSLMTLKNYGINCKGVIYNGEANESSEKAIDKFAQVRVLGHIPILKRVDQQTINKIELDLKL